MPNPEELARENIDKQLKACGWEVQSRTEMNLYASREVAEREFPLNYWNILRDDCRLSQAILLLALGSMLYFLVYMYNKEF